MPWVLADILIGVCALLLFAGVALGGYRHVRALLRTGKDASARLGAAMPPPLEPRP